MNAGYKTATTVESSVYNMYIIMFAGAESGTNLRAVMGIAEAR
eukprot:CAMPEP_0119405734 /NCGR_PEP_ID=MMETSP1335-20130426/327_1 /TAXON_ID=259385 /ORGANISM="Chrysoculter rhomboideus, Strain RCC1486" /LENGTH=42 /DNA_ID= /DNA_START= /DNA_END= /DNA_ORIENTATION=